MEGQKHTPASAWNELEDEYLKEAWKQGKTASEISAALIERKLNPLVSYRSRNSVIGRAHRIGLLDNSIEKRPSPIKRNANKLPDVKQEPEPRMTYEGCRWIFGEGNDKHTCGKEQVKGKPFCQEHCEVAYTKKADRALQKFEDDSLMKPKNSDAWNRG